MLILSRKLRESIRLNHDIEIKIIHIYGNCVSIGIDAPKDVIIYRQELYNALFPKHEEKKETKTDCPV